MRVELRDGQWAELRERISHGQDKEIKRAYVHGKDGDVFEAQTVMVRHFAKAWHILDIEGAAIPLDDPAAVDRMPDDIVDDLFNAATDLYKGITRPNPLTPPSSDGSS